MSRTAAATSSRPTAALPWPSGSLATAALVAAILLLATSALAQAPGPCNQEPRHGELDFWLGEWRILGPEGETVGHSRVESAQGGCLVIERWTSADGDTGQSMSYLDPATGTWRQVWVDAEGGVVRYEGRVEGGALRFAGVDLRADGSSREARVVLQPLGDGRLRHEIEHRADDGSWEPYFDGTYEPLGSPDDTMAVAESAADEDRAEEPAPADPVGARPAPAPAATGSATASEVKALSDEVDEATLAAAARSRVTMASPMTLEVALGPLELYPEKAAWTTDETAPYRCNGVTLREVGAARSLRRGKATIEARLLLHTEQRAQRVGVVVELLDPDGETVARVEEPRISLGLMINAYDPEEGLLRTLDMEIDRERFDQLFAGDRRPSLRVTIAAP